LNERIGALQADRGVQDTELMVGLSLQCAEHLAAPTAMESSNDTSQAYFKQPLCKLLFLLGWILWSCERWEE